MDTGDAFVFDDLDDLGNDARPVRCLARLVRDLGEDQALPLARILHVMPGTDPHTSAAGGVGAVDSVAAHDDAARGEVRARHDLHQVADRDLRVVQNGEGGITDFMQVVGWHGCRHANGDAVRSIAEQIGEAAGQHGRLRPRLVVVGLEFDGVLVEVAHQLCGHTGHPRLGVSHGGGRVGVDGAEVALPIHERVAQGEVLGHAHERRVDNRLAVWVVVARGVAGDLGALAVLGPRTQVQVIHGDQNPALAGLEAVAHVGQCPRVDDAERISQVRLMHLARDAARDGRIG